MHLDPTKAHYIRPPQEELESEQLHRRHAVITQDRGYECAACGALLTAHWDGESLYFYERLINKASQFSNAWAWPLPDRPPRHACLALAVGQAIGVVP